MTIALAFTAFAKAIPCLTPFLATSDPSVLRRILAYIWGLPCGWRGWVGLTAAELGDQGLQIGRRGTLHPDGIVGIFARHCFILDTSPQYLLLCVMCKYCKYLHVLSATL